MFAGQRIRTLHCAIPLRQRVAQFSSIITLFARSMRGAPALVLWADVVKEGRVLAGLTGCRLSFLIATRGAASLVLRCSSQIEMPKM